MNISQDADGVITRGGGGGGGYDFSGMSGDIGNLVGGLGGHSGKAFQDAMDQYQIYGKKAEDTQNPFLNMGKQAIPQYQQWLQGMKDPSGFINNLMSKYNESPWAKYQQDQSARRFGNAGSASGLTGSTPLAQFEQQSMHDISSQDQDKWLQNVLGINKEYGGGLDKEIGYGQHSADQLTSMYGDMGRQMAEAAAGKRAGEDADDGSFWSGAIGLAGTAAGTIFGGPAGGMAGGAIGRGIGSKFG